jgi:tetratricopeptide (TPR) repeat protein
VVVTILVAALAYANAVANDFALDDGGVIVRNALVHDWRGVWRAFATPYWPDGGGQYRPLTIAHFTADWVLSGGDPRWFHALNVAWHAAASLAAWAVLRGLLSAGGALGAALLFAVHPVHVEAVANVVGRAELIAATGVLTALWLHRRGSAWAAVPFALGLCAKESAIVFLGLAPLLDLAAGTLPRAPRDVARRYGASVAVAVAFIAAMLWVLRGGAVSSAEYLWGGVGAGQRILTMVAVLPHVARLLVFPVDLSADYSPAYLRFFDGVDLAFLAGVALSAAYLLALPAVWRRDRAAFVGLAWIPVAWSPVANVAFASGVILAERTLYLPSVGVVLLAGVALERLARRRRGLALAGAAVVLGAATGRTWTRTPVWRDNRTLVVRTATDHPEAYWIHAAMGNLWIRIGDRAAAAREFDRALTLFPRNPEVWEMAGENRRAIGDLAAADSLFTRGLALAPRRDYALRLFRGDVRLARGDAPTALADAEAVLRTHRDSLQPRLLRVQALERLGRRADADRLVDTLTRRWPADPDARRVVGALRAGRNVQGAVAIVPREPALDTTEQKP